MVLDNGKHRNYIFNKLDFLNAKSQHNSHYKMIQQLLFCKLSIIKLFGKFLFPFLLINIILPLLFIFETHFPPIIYYNTPIINFLYYIYNYQFILYNDKIHVFFYIF